MAKRTVRTLSLFLTGGYLYGLIEIFFRGYTHPSMFVLGGLCLVGIGALRRALPTAPLAEKMLFSGALITAAEFACGVVVNLIFDMGVWDYSHIAWNLFGQICLPFSAFWCLLSLPAMGVDKLLWERRAVIGNREK